MVSPLGNDVQSSWSRLLAGESGAAEITAFDHSDYNVHFACELKDFDPTVWVDRKAARRMDRFAQMIIAAARQAEQDSGVDISEAPDRYGASIATGIGGLQSYQECYHVLLTKGPDRVSPFSIPSIIPNMGAGWVSIELGTKGPLMSECTACAASNMAIGDALDMIRAGRVDVMFAGGTEAPITEVGIAGFDAMRALSRRNDDPAHASRPFDNERDGLVMGEAAGGARARRARARAGARRAHLRRARRLRHVVGRRAHDRARPDGREPGARDDDGARDAGVDPSEIGYVNAHATSTPLGDAAETRVIKIAFGEAHAKNGLAVSSTKGATGHCFGAAGAVEAVFTTMAVVDKKAPPTINYDEPDPECDLDYVPNAPRDLPDLKVAMSNSFGFGGHNASIVVRAFE